MAEYFYRADKSTPETPVSNVAQIVETLNSKSAEERLRYPNEELVEVFMRDDGTMVEYKYASKDFSLKETSDGVVIVFYNCNKALFNI
jgi:hypothetical protein